MSFVARSLHRCFVVAWPFFPFLHQCACNVFGSCPPMHECISTPRPALKGVRVCSRAKHCKCDIVPFVSPALPFVVLPCSHLSLRHSLFFAPATRRPRLAPVTFTSHAHPLHPHAPHLLASVLPTRAAIDLHSTSLSFVFPFLARDAPLHKHARTLTLLSLPTALCCTAWSEIARIKSTRQSCRSIAGV